MVDAIEFLPMEVTKDFMSLTVGDVLRMSISTGRYELVAEDEDIGENKYSYNKYKISLEPWIIQKYSDHFQVYDPIPELPETETEVDGRTRVEVSHPTLLDDNIETTVTTASDSDEQTVVDLEGNVSKDVTFINKGITVDMTSIIMDIEDLAHEIDKLKLIISDISVKPKSKVKK